MVVVNSCDGEGAVPVMNRSSDRSPTSLPWCIWFVGSHSSRKGKHIDISRHSGGLGGSSSNDGGCNRQLPYVFLFLNRWYPQSGNTTFRGVWIVIPVDWIERATTYFLRSCFFFDFTGRATRRERERVRKRVSVFSFYHWMQ
ncbi:unnamed protein product [Lactuca virosa]|uniref:Uncharacterized protein n=1 Tax=Lactuca virosa TaxID=75947 RepID=A0AAU9NGC6_9ASTR|nr:unnamed protein product [Lactuca virosa]